MTMPGRSCVALTLLIVFKAGEAANGSYKLRFRKFQLAARRTACGCARNDPPAAGRLEARWRKKASSANKQYRRADSARSIVVSLHVLCAVGGGLGHYFFDFGGIAGEGLGPDVVNR